MRAWNKLGDKVIRTPRSKDLKSTIVREPLYRKPKKRFAPPLMLLYSCIGLILAGGLLLLLPQANADNRTTPILVAFFTATSAVTVTGLTVVDTPDYWTSFGHSIIFCLMLIGGLGFTTLATFFLIILGQRITLPERMLMRDTIGVDQMGGLAAVMRNIVIIVLIIYLVGTIAIWWQIRGSFPLGESLWQSAFLSVSAFNNAGFSILPNTTSLENFASNAVLLMFISVLIIIGGLSWTAMIDVGRQRRFSRLTLDTKLVVTTSIFLWIIGAIMFFAAEFENEMTIGSLSFYQKAVHSVFQSISGRTAGLTTIDFGQSTGLTKLFYPLLMFVGGAAGSLAGGIKVATLAVIISAVLSSIKGRHQTEAFGRQIPHFQVHRAVAVVALCLTWVFLASLALTLTEDNIPASMLLFDTISAFGTTGLSTGVPSQLSQVGSVIFMITMVVGRLGPLTMALALAPQDEYTVYRFAEERVKIG